MDDESVRAYLERGYPRLVAGLSLVCRSRALAEDAVQEALARAWVQESKGERIEALNAWIATVALNIARSHLRRMASELRARNRLVPGKAIPGDDDESHRVDRRLDLMRAISALSRRQREAVILRYFAELEMPQVAEALSLTEGAARALLFRARRALLLSLGAHEEGAYDDAAG